MRIETIFPVFAKLLSPVLTVYVNTSDHDATRHPRTRSELAWLQDAAAALRRELSHGDQKLFNRQVQRVHRFLERRRSAERAIVVFASGKCWHVVPLRASVKNELSWGKPKIALLLSLLHAHRRYGVVVIDHMGVRYFVWAQGDLTLLGSGAFEIDASQWKRKDQGRVGTQRMRKSRGPLRDVYERRITAQYKRLCHHVAEEIASLAMKQGFDGLRLVGPDRLINTVQEKIPSSLAASVVAVHENLGRSSPRELQRRLQPLVDHYEKEQQLAEVKLLRASEQGAITNPDEVLAELQDGRIRALLVARDLELALRQCPKCGQANRGADRVCPDCGEVREEISLSEFLAQVLPTGNVKLEFVNDDAAQLLRRTGGLGGWLRPVRAAAAV